MDSWLWRSTRYAAVILWAVIGGVDLALWMRDADPIESQFHQYLVGLAVSLTVLAGIWSLSRRAYMAGYTSRIEDERSERPVRALRDD